MTVKKQVCMNARMVWIEGSVVSDLPESFLVDFSFEGVDYRGLWPKASVIVVEE